MCTTKKHNILLNCSKFFIVFRHGGLAQRKAYINGIKILFYNPKTCHDFHAHFNRFLRIGD